MTFMKKSTRAIKIAITYEKGGCGKTTTAVNLSAILAERGNKVLLVDLDKQAYATSYYNCCDENQPCIFEVMQGIVNCKQAIITTGFDNLFLLPSSRRFAGIETFLMMKTKRQEYTLQSVLEPVENDFDYIIMDCPPSGERIKENALTTTDFVILPIIPDDFAVSGLVQIAQEIVEIKRYTNPTIEVLGVLITQFERNKNKMEYTKAFKSQNMLPCFETVIRKNTALSEAINHHKPINKYKKSCNGYKDYNSLTDEILQTLKGCNKYGN